MPAQSLRILLAEDHALVRAGLRALLQQSAGFVVVAEAEDGRAALELVAAQRPDVVLMDISMKNLNGLEATARIAREFPQVRVVILSMHEAEEYVQQAFQAGAVGYLLKGAQSGELELALRAVARGEYYVSPSICRFLVSGYLRRDDPGGDRSAPLDCLTPRQREILQLIAEGRSTKEIARQLTLSVKTVENHRAQLMARLGIHDVAGLVRFALRAGLISAED